MLSLLKSNMNIQFVTGIYGLLAYLTSYMCKPERNMSELMKKASKEASGKNVKDKLRSIGNVFLTKREVSTHEAIVRSLSLQMRTSRIQTVYIPTGIKNNRTRMLKDQSVLETMDPEDTNVYQSNMLEKYANRPDDLEQMCYADFATTYISKSAIEAQVESEDIKNYTMPIGAIDEVEPTSRIIVLKNELGKMKKRSRPCVMRYHKVTKLKDSEQYYMILLQLYMPWRNEDNIKGDCPTYGEKFSADELSIKPNILKHDPNFEKYDIDPDDLHHYADSESESDEADDDYGMINPDLIDLDYDENSDDGNSTVPVPSTTVEDLSIPRELFYEMCSKLNLEQQELFNFITKYATECQLSKKNDQPMPDPFHIFLSGGAGVGKSYLINLITEQLRKVLREPGQNSDKEPSVLVTASTGKAATNINGTTLHSAFTLPLYGVGRVRNVTLSNEQLHNYRLKYNYLKVLLVDEISMTGQLTFNDLNKRFQIIKDNELRFGGVSLLLIGDFLQLPPVK